ncbi:MAG: hypothetical protein ABFS35_10930 [Bacteroidota bacterium]
MKKLFYLLIVSLVVLTMYSCKKDSDPVNHFSFQGKEYPINEAVIVELVFSEGNADELVVPVLSFTNISGQDTTGLLLSVFDEESNILGGNYSSLGQDEFESASRGIAPFALIFLSAITFQDETTYFTGHGGSLDVSVSGDNYTIKMNSISAGEYGDLLDFDEDGNFEYSEAGKIAGVYEGTINKQITVLSMDMQNSDIDINKLIKSIKNK